MEGELHSFAPPSLKSEPSSVPDQDLEQPKPSQTVYILTNISSGRLRANLAFNFALERTRSASPAVLAFAPPLRVIRSSSSFSSEGSILDGRT